MARNSAPFNGPSKTGNPSGKGRGNNPTGGSDDDGGATWTNGDPFEGFAERAGASFDRFIRAEAKREDDQRAAWKEWGERQWVATTIQDVKAALLERFAFGRSDNSLKRIVLFVRTCKCERDEATADRVADLLCELMRENRVLVGNLAKKDNALMDEVQGQLSMADWGRYYDAQFAPFADEEELARWSSYKAEMGI